jgi:hypothetical protein
VNDLALELGLFLAIIGLAFVLVGGLSENDPD